MKHYPQRGMATSVAGSAPFAGGLAVDGQALLKRVIE